MAHLARPHARHQESFLAAMEELRAEGRATSASILGEDLRTWSGTWETAAGFTAYVGSVLAEGVDTPPPGRVRQTTWWWVEGEEWLGRVSLRHELTERLREVGGHIGYDVRPSVRRQGHATAMLAAVLPEAAALGIERALVTCDHDNLGSIGVIEANGGLLEDRRGSKLRYWIDTAQQPQV